MKSQRRPPKPKKPGHGRKSADDYEGAKRVEVKNDSLKRGDPCPVCPTNKQGKVYQVKQPKNLVRIVGQAPLQATIYELEKLRCNLCGEIFVAQPPPGVGDKKYDATAAAMIGLLKYGGGMPFYRLANLQSSLKIPLPVSTQWDVINAAQAELEPAYKELLRQAAQGHLVYNDDTTMRVLDLRKTIDELNKAGKTDRKGIFTTGIISEIAQGRRVALYFTGRNHAGENLAEVLALRAKALDAPMQMCDALDCNVTGDFETILSNCLTHARRKFVEVATRFPAECSHVLKQLGQVYANDAKARQEKMSDQERLVHHQTHSSTTMTDLKIWMDEKIDKKLVEPNSPLGAAIAYMTKRWEKFTVFLRLPGAPLDNNITERALKKAILHRKNALFYKTEHGAKTGDIFMSLIQTADAAGSNPFDYLVALLTNQSAVAQYPERWMPWNYEAALADAKASVCEVSA